MQKAINRVSSEAVKNATGKTWDEWIKILDKEGAKNMPHKDIARLLKDKKYIKSGWWCQMVTVGYEYVKGRRVLGETKDAGFEIGVTKTIKISPKAAWDFLVSSKGRDIWLGKVSRFTLKPGARYETKEGTTGEIRTIKKGERIRLTFQQKAMKSPSTLQVTITPRKTTKGTCISFHQEKLSDQKSREKMRTHWQAVLEKLAKLCQKNYYLIAEGDTSGQSSPNPTYNVP